MKIHGGKKDYYDGAMGFGLDPKLHYNRRSFTVDYERLKNKPPRKLTEQISRWGWTSNDKFKEMNERVIVGFCGRLYPCIRISIGEQKNPISVYNVDGLRESSPSYRDELKRERRLIGRLGRQRGLNWNRKRREDFLNNPPIEIHPLFIELGVPVLTITRDESRYLNLIPNDCLKDFQFYKMVEPYTAFQEIAMYLGNQLARQGDPGTVPDKYRIAQHGFDPVRSFRNMPR